MIIYLSSLSLGGKIRYVYPNFALKHAVIDNYIIKLQSTKAWTTIKYITLIRGYGHVKKTV